MFRWNLLLFGGAAAAAVVSGHADIALPLVAAAEVAYLAGLTTLPRFQSAIDAKARAEQRGLSAAPGRTAVTAGDARDRILEVLKSLTEDRRSRFLRLRARCVEMSRIANAVRGDTRDASGASTRAAHARARPPAVGVPAPAAVRAGDRAVPAGRRRARRSTRRSTTSRSAARSARTRSARRTRPTIGSSARSTTASRPPRRARRTSRRRGTTPSSSRPSSTASRTRSRRSPRWRSATPIPTRCRAASTRSPRASRRPSRRSASCSRSPASATRTPRRRSSTPISHRSAIAEGARSRTSAPMTPDARSPRSRPRRRPSPAPTG